MKFNWDTLLDYNVDTNKDRILAGANILKSNVNIGSGDVRIPGFINLDIDADGKKVDVIAKAESLPFKSNSISFICIDHVIEYSENPWQIVEEIDRVLKKDGLVYVSSAFIYPYHPKPLDNFRFTLSGLKCLFSGFEVLKEGVAKSAFSSSLAVIVHLLASIFSFNSLVLFKFFKIFFSCLLFPFKYLDFFLMKFDHIPRNIFSNSYLLLKKIR